ncbi:M24 family metallopeptidase [Halorussus lipolyticus]|uniref:M24 family metallopeptidase n=1 Tax=Halorussus lipolyticus TaxID=3034024 RepID=UPI0023E82146|nr:M24 family metallopeptidase [Halorussus sp. DT80]
MPDADLIAEKTEQAADALAEQDVDCWLTFCRETTEIHEPCLPFLLGFDVVWPTAIVVSKEDRSAVVVGRHDAPNARELPHEVYPYDESLEEALLGLLDEIDPDEIAVNFSRDDNTADGLTHGMYLRLRDLLSGTDYDESLTSAEDVISAVRGIKSPTERARVRQAVETTEELLGEMRDRWDPDWTEADVSDWLHDRMDDRGLGSAWSWDYCPTVHAGGDREVGHTLPGELTLPPGEVLHIDFGVKQDGYSADMQRLFYRPSDENPEPPEGLREAFADVRSAIEAGRERIAPGVAGHEVDSAARDELTDRGWPEYEHAFGHQVGRNAHDGGTLLGPQWDRYGSAPEGEIRAGEIYTVELGADTEWGYLGLEEMLLVTDEGTEWLTDPQESLSVLARPE